MKEKVTIPLMVTGGLRQAAAMEEVLASGCAEMIGIGRPMCVLTDAPKQLFAGLKALPRYENTLSLLPGWLQWLENFKTLRAVAGFAVQYWYYAQLELLGQSGKSKPGLSVFAATRRVMAQQKNWLAARR
jgi:hypothetical protein